MISVIAKLPVKEGKVDEFIEEFKGLIAHVAKEEGTLFYTINRKRSEPNTIVVMERYRDKADFDAHSSTPHFKNFSSRFPEFMAGKPEITLMEEIDSI